MKDNLTDREKYYVERYDFINTELSRLQNDMLHIEEATARLLSELQSLRQKEQIEFKETETDGKD